MKIATSSHNSEAGVVRGTALVLDDVLPDPVL